MSVNDICNYEEQKLLTVLPEIKICAYLCFDLLIK